METFNIIALGVYVACVVAFVGYITARGARIIWSDPRRFMHGAVGVVRGTGREGLRVAAHVALWTARTAWRVALWLAVLVVAAVVIYFFPTFALVAGIFIAIGIFSMSVSGR